MRSNYLCSPGDDSSDGDEFSDAIGLHVPHRCHLQVRRALEIDLVATHQLLREVVRSRTEISQSGTIFSLNLVLTVRTMLISTVS
jgi:hypothetical protein